MQPISLTFKRLEAFNRRYWPWLTVACLTAICLASLSPQGSAGDPGDRDKILHVLAYAAASGPAAMAGRLRPVPIVIGIFAVGLMIEAVQPLVGRSAHPGDLVANLAGVILGVSAGHVLGRLIRKM